MKYDLTVSLSMCASFLTFYVQFRSARKYLMGLRILPALIIVLRAFSFGILIAAMGCTSPLRNNHACHDKTTLIYTRIHTHKEAHRARVKARSQTHSYTYAQLHCVRTILLRGGELPEECAFLVHATPHLARYHTCHAPLTTKLQRPCLPKIKDPGGTMWGDADEERCANMRTRSLCPGLTLFFYLWHFTNSSWRPLSF